MTRIIMVLATLLLLAGGCNGDKPVPPDSSSGESQQPVAKETDPAGSTTRQTVGVDPDDGPSSRWSRKHSREEMSEEGQSGGSLADFPRDVPLLPDAALASAGRGDERRNHALLTTALSPSDVFDFYQGALPTEGWNVLQTTRKPGQQVLMASKDDRRVLVTAVDRNGETQVSIAVQSATVERSGRGARRTEEAADEDDRQGRGQGRGRGGR